MKFTLHKPFRNFSTYTSLIVLVVCFNAFYSCTTTVKRTSYLNQLNKDTSLVSQASLPEALKIKSNDVLSIQVSSLNTELDEKFNALAKFGANEMNGNGFLSGHEVDAQGKIRLHFLGDVFVAGKTRYQLAKQLETDLQPYLKDPIVKINFLNKKITVMGEVGTPKIISLKDEYLHILDALVVSGDLKDDAVINDVILIRDSAQNKIVKHINLEDQSMLTSEWSILQPDDVLYIKKDITIRTKEERKRSLQQTFSLIVSVVTFLAIIFNSLIK